MTAGNLQGDHTSALRAAVDVLLFAPCGFGAMLIEDAPKAIRRARQELDNARFIGRFTVDQGVAELRSRIDATSPVEVDGHGVADGKRVSDSAPVESPPSGDATARDADPATLDADDDAGDPIPAPGDLALPDYDTLPAIDIVAKLDTVGLEDRIAIERYERANRQRRTVLGKLAQLAAQ